MTMPVLNEQLSDADLWQLVRQGSTAAFEVLVRRHQSLICAVAYNACGDLALSEDVAQETFWAAWRERASLAEPSQLRAWLCGIARNLGHNSQRRAFRQAGSAGLDAAADVPTPEPSPVEIAVSREEQTLLWQALEQIPEAYREPLILYYREEQSVADVAVALGLSRDAVKQRLSRGRSMLQARLAGVVEEALRRSRPGRPFTVAVMAGLATLSTATKNALAGAGAAAFAGPAVKATAAGLANSILGASLGSLGGLVGAWLGSWVPAQLADTKYEREYLRRAGQRVFLVSVLFAVVLTVPTLAYAGRLSIAYFLAFLATWTVIYWTYLAVECVSIARGVRRIRIETPGAEANDALLRVRLDAVAARYRGRVFRSRASFLRLPLLDVNVRDPGHAGRSVEPRVARGWIAIGDDAYGVLFAFGGRARALIAVGGLAVGLVALGGVALGAFAVGGLSVGIFACGGLAIGWQAGGGLALAWDAACGGGAVAWHAAYGGAAAAQGYAVGGAAWARHANDGAAKTILFRYPLIQGFDWYLANLAWITPVVVLAVLLWYSVMVRLMYRRHAPS
jgi:zinc protease